eukprot:GFUD01035385.1.p1 GENE.GFUD01035385.1~~GFUD01035385.1.p1  ORF type:complete len:856 (+),score=188.99 GFUD01035385.1:100-2667(+)
MSVILTRTKYPLYYPTQVNPKKSGTTKGGYLEGYLLLPERWKPGTNLRIKIFCVPHEDLCWEDADSQIRLEKKNTSRDQDKENIHPCLLHLVYMKGGRRNNKDEPEPSFDNSVKQLVIEGENIKDLATNVKIAKVEKVGNGEGCRIGLGKGGTNLNINLLLPKTKAKYLGGGVVEEEEMKIVIRKMIKDKNSSDNLVIGRKTEMLNNYFHENNSINLNKMRIEVEFISDSFSLSTLSVVIQSQGHKKTANIKFETPNILKCCTKGGRTVVMESKCSFSKDTKPKLVAYKKEPNGNIVQDPETQTLIRQPDPQNINISKINNSIRFDTPEQDEKILQPNILLRLVCVWMVDEQELAANEFKFQYVRHPWPRGGLCVFCELDVDGMKQKEDAIPETNELMSLVEERQTGENEAVSITDNTTILEDDVNLSIEDLIDFNYAQDSESSNSSVRRSSSDSFTVVGMDSEYARQATNMNPSFSNIQAMACVDSDRSDTSSSNESFVIVSRDDYSSESHNNVSPAQVLPAFSDFQGYGGFSFVQDNSTSVNLGTECASQSAKRTNNTRIDLSTTIAQNTNNASQSVTLAHDDQPNYQVSCYQQQHKRKEGDSNLDFLSSLHLFGNLNLYSIGEILCRKDVSYHDPDQYGLFQKTIVHVVSQDRGLSFVDVLSFPHFDRVSNTIQHRSLRDYFPARKHAPSLLVLHRFGGAIPNTVHQFLSDNPGDEYPMKNLSHALHTLLSRGQSINYIVLHNMSSTLIIRLGDPARYCPQSVANYNPFSVTTMVQTNNDQEFPEEAFEKLLEIISKDLGEVGMTIPQFLVSHQEIRASWQEGWISNIDRLRRVTGMRKPSLQDFAAIINCF